MGFEPPPPFLPACSITHLTMVAAPPENRIFCSISILTYVFMGSFDAKNSALMSV